MGKDAWGSFEKYIEHEQKEGFTKKSPPCYHDWDKRVKFGQKVKTCKLCRITVADD